MRLGFLVVGLSLAAGCAVAPKVVDYQSFHSKTFSSRPKPAEVQSRETAQLLSDGYLLIGYIDLRRNIQTCYEDNQCIQHSGVLPPRTELQQEAAKRGGDVVTLLEERTILEPAPRSECASTGMIASTVNGIVTMTPTCNSYRTIEGNLEAKVSRALIWRYEPEAAAGEANAKAIELAMQTLDKAANQPDKRGATGLDSAVDAVLGAGDRRKLADAQAADDLTRRLFTAITTNDRETFATLARDGTLAKWTDEEGATALMVAIASRNLPAARSIAALEPGLGRVDKNGYGALQFAVMMGDRELVAQLAKAGHDLRAPLANGGPLLFMAVVNDDSGVYDWLIGQGLDPGARDPEGRDLLMMAAEFGRMELVTQRLKAGSDPNGRTSNGETPLMAAARGGKPETLKALLDAGARPDARDDSGRTLLHYAAAGGSTDVSATALGLGVGIDTEDNEGRTALIESIAAEKWTVAGLLLDRGTKTRTTTFGPGDIAYALVDRDQPALLARFAGLVPGLQEELRGNPEWLRLAATDSGAATVDYLIKLGAGVNGSSGSSAPLLAAAAAGNAATTRALMEHKADATVRDARNLTPLRVATQAGHAEVVAVLREFDVAE